MSSAQGLDISPWIVRLRPQHVITKLYQSVELHGGGASYSMAHARTARAAGCSVGGYVWLYADIPGEQQVADALDTAERAQIPLGPMNPLWLDCERYDAQASNPSVQTISQAVAACEARNLPVGIYTGKYWWQEHTGDSQQFAHLPLWRANYNGSPTLQAPGFGGWQQDAGHQWTSSPIDQSVFDARWATAP